MTICPASGHTELGLWPYRLRSHDGQTIPSPLGGGRRLARLPDHLPGMGEAHRLARRHAQARLEAAARLERGTGDGRHLRAHQERPQGNVRTVAMARGLGSLGYRASFTVDSVVADSGTPAAVAVTMTRARRLVFDGRLDRRGEFRNPAASDTALAQSLIQLLGNFRDFLPRLPAEGLKLGADWTDTLAGTQRGGGALVTRRTIAHSAAAAWEDHGGVHSLRLDIGASYTIQGSGDGGGRPAHRLPPSARPGRRARPVGESGRPGARARSVRERRRHGRRPWGGRPPAPALVGIQLSGPLLRLPAGRV